MALFYSAIDGRRDYRRMGNSRFCEWLPGEQVRHEWAGLGFRGGYKIHVTADEADADAVAGLLLPYLRERETSHKIVFSPEQYRLLNQGPQKGKFITIYVGPSLETFTRIVAGLENRLADSRFRPGPTPTMRHGGNSVVEQRIGRTGFLSYYVIEDYTW